MAPENAAEGSVPWAELTPENAELLARYAEPLSARRWPGTEHPLGRTGCCLQHQSGSASRSMR